MRETVFRLLRLPHDETAVAELAGIVPDGNDLGDSAALLQKVNMTDVVQIDGGAQATWPSSNSSAGVSFDENMISSPTMPTLSARINSGRELQSAPKPSAWRIFRMNGIGRGLDGEELLEAGIPGKQFGQTASVLPDRLLDRRYEMESDDRERLPLIGCAKTEAFCRSFVSALTKDLSDVCQAWQRLRCRCARMHSSCVASAPWIFRHPPLVRPGFRHTGG